MRKTYYFNLSITGTSDGTPFLAFIEGSRHTDIVANGFYNAWLSLPGTNDTGGELKFKCLLTHVDPNDVSVEWRL